MNDVVYMDSDIKTAEDVTNAEDGRVGRILSSLRYDQFVVLCDCGHDSFTHGRDPREAVCVCANCWKPMAAHMMRRGCL